MKKTRKTPPIFYPKTLACAIAVSLMAMSGTVSANSTGSSSGSAGSGTGSSTGASSSNATTDSTKTGVNNTYTSGGQTYQRIGDLEIYQSAQGGGAGIMMMLDISGSMGPFSEDKDNPAMSEQCTKDNKRGFRAYKYYMTDENGKRITKFMHEGMKKEVNVSDGFTLWHWGCPGSKADGSDDLLMRLDRLKRAVIELVADERNLSSKNSIGIGTFPQLSVRSNIMIPTKPLTLTHRYDIINYIRSLWMTGPTPSAAAYAEAGAYMLGTKTETVRENPIKAYMELGELTYEGAKKAWKFVPCGRHSLSGMQVKGGNTVSICDWRETAQPDLYRAGHDNAIAKWLLSVKTQYNSRIFSEYPTDIKFTPIGLPDYIISANFDGEKKRKLTDGNYVGDISSLYRGPHVWGKDTFVYNEIDYTPVQNYFSGFGLSSNATKTADFRSYNSPVAANQSCDGFGIYFLTDGEPNSIHPDKKPELAAAMALSLNDTDGGASIVKATQTSLSTAGTAFIDNNGWEYIGAYAKRLRSGNNPKNTVIKTATVGFGNIFNGGDATNCSSYSNADARNLCKWGSIKEDYGQGGFTATSTAEGIKNSITQFLGILNQVVSTQPAGTISVPKDPLSVNNIQPYAYLPMIEPKLAETRLLWNGNLKKYHTLNGTLYAKNGTTRLYVPSPSATAENTTYPSQFNATAQDIWQAQDIQEMRRTAANPETLKDKVNGSIDIGGSYEGVVDLATDSQNSRIVYLEVHERDPSGKLIKKLVDVGIKNGQMHNFDKLDSFYTVADKAYLLNYLGLAVSVGDTIPKDDAALQTAFTDALGKKRFNKKLLGGVVHSVPVMATYAGKFNQDGGISSDEKEREDHIVYGSMDGAVHMVAAKDGKENFAFIPRAMFEDVKQRDALLYEKLDGSVKAGEPKFGVDAPWTTYAEYIYNFSQKPALIKAQKMYAFGGLRMGGNGIYGLDITSKDKPLLNFSIDRTTAGFERMGQIWSKPVMAKIRVSNTGRRVDQYKDVVIFSGGYDMCYEHPLFKLGASPADALIDYTSSNTDEMRRAGSAQKMPAGEVTCTQKEARGNAVYMVEATTGKLLARWQKGDTNAQGGRDDREFMTHSVVGEIATLDSNNNGAIDHLYFADLGGQVFRVDLKELVDGGSAMTRRVVRVLDANGDTKSKNNNTHINYRFYEKPLVSFYDEEVSGKSFAVVNIASGDRSSPVHTHRKVTNANRIFGVFDRDLTTNKLDRAGINLDKMLSRNITTDNLQHIETDKLEIAGASGATQIINNLRAAVANTNPAQNGSVRQGWYYDMIRFDGRIGVSGLKSMGTGTVLANVYYANIYSPSYDYTTGDSCSARVSGGTERQLYCLPWGICADTSDGNKLTTKNGVLGYIKAGPGIQDLALGTVTNERGKSGAFRTILGHQMLSELSASKGKSTASTGGDNSAWNRLITKGGDGTSAGSVTTGADVYGAEIIPTPKYTLAVQRWYDLQNENQSNN